MRFLIILLITFLLGSCISVRESKGTSESFSFDFDVETERFDGIVDSGSGSSNEPNRLEIKINQNNNRDNSESNPQYENYELLVEEEREQRNEISEKEKEKKHITDKTTSKGLQDPKKGIMAYSVPNEMTLGKFYNIKLRISKEKDKVKLIQGDNQVNISQDTNYNITIESVRVEPIMTAELYGDKESFKINPVSTELQNIEEFGYTEWEWQVVPLKSGIQFLKLIVRVRVKVEDITTFKDITVFDKNIKIKSNIKYVSSNFISDNWQWLMTTIIIPLVIYFWNRKRKKSRKNS